nr:MAG TPA: hypothetical protein [Bacteriophage sp.]
MASEAISLICLIANRAIVNQLYAINSYFAIKTIASK